MEIVVRAAVMYVVLLCLLRAMGRRELSELTTFDLLITVVIGDLIQQGVTQEDMSFTGGLLAVGTMCLLAVASSYVGMRSLPRPTRARRRSGGDRPQGRALRGGHASRAHHESRADGGARGEQVSDLAKFDLVVVEADGRFSFLRADHD